jgi:twitching motility protein PilT
MQGGFPSVAVEEGFHAVAGTRVLVVNEDTELLDRLEHAFEVAGHDFELLGALSAPRAIGVASKKQPDVILVNADLDGMDGFDFAKHLKKEEVLKEIPVVILEAEPSEVSALKSRQAGAAGHLPLSVDADTLAQKIGSLANGDPKAAEAPADAPAESGAADSRGADYGTPQPVSEEESHAVPKPEVGSAAPPAPDGPPSERVEPGRDGITGERQMEDLPSVDDMLRLLIERGGSDLHITVGSAPGLRLRGDIVPVENTRSLTPKDTQHMILNLLSEEQRRRFETELELDFAYSIPGFSRFRANVFQQRNSMAAVFRVIPLDIPTLEALHLPKVCKYLAERPRGLVLVTGPTGSGKSTTQAAMIDHINETRQCHVITLEDPIEFLHPNRNSYLNQREVGEDTMSFGSALKRVLRQDPDVILVGEMRDLETISAAITAAETGHLVIATLHTTGGPETVDRVIDVFPPHQQQQVRMQLSTTLEGVLSQVLLRSTDGRGRVMAMEIMLGVPAIRNLVREGKTHQMATIIQGGASVGMQTLDQHLRVLLQSGKITYEEAIGKAQNPRELAQMMGRTL